MKGTADLARGFQGDAKALQVYAAALKTFSDQCRRLVLVEAPTRISVIPPVCELLEQLASTTVTFSAAWQRVSDDIRDIYERYLVVERVAADQKAIAKTLDAARLKLKAYEDEIEQAATRPDFQRGRTELQFLRLRFAKREAIVKTRDATILLINEHKKFARFMFRRTRDAFLCLGHVIADGGTTEVQILTKLIEGLQKARWGEALTDTSYAAVDVAVMERPAIPVKPLDSQAGEVPLPPPPPKVVKPTPPPKVVKPTPPPQPVVVANKVKVTAKNAILFEDTAFQQIASARKRAETDPAQAQAQAQAEEEPPKKLDIFDVGSLNLVAEPAKPAPRSAEIKLIPDEPEWEEGIFDLEAEGIEVPELPEEMLGHPDNKKTVVNPFDDL
jgi:hypothetical protein